MKNEYIVIKEPEIEVFTAAEITIIDDAFEHVCLENTAKSISEQTHGVIWALADMGEEIPYEAVFASNVGEVDETDIAWARDTQSVAA